MIDATNDHPNVMIFPPAILAATLAFGFLCQWLMPVGLLFSLGLTFRVIVGGVLLVAGLFVLINGRLALVRHGTNVSPLQPTIAIVTEGAYRWTRNPLDVGGVIALLGISVLFAIDWILLFLLPGVALLHFGVIRREEEYLDRKFGDVYRRYRANVPRYLWPI